MFELPFVFRPRVETVTPNHGPMAGGTVVTITGLHLTGAIVVSFGPTPALDFQVIDDMTLTATTPASNAPLSVEVFVTTLGGVNDWTPTFTYDEPAKLPPTFWSTYHVISRGGPDKPRLVLDG